MLIRKPSIAKGTLPSSQPHLRQELTRVSASCESRSPRLNVRLETECKHPYFDSRPDEPLGPPTPGDPARQTPPRVHKSEDLRSCCLLRLPLGFGQKRPHLGDGNH